MSLTRRYFRTLKRARHRLSGVICLSIVVALFAGLAITMGAANMLNTIMHTAHDLLLNTCFFLMAVCVITGPSPRISASPPTSRSTSSSPSPTLARPSVWD